MTPTTDKSLYVLDMPEEDYHSQSALSASGMKVLLKSPKHFQQARRVRVEKAEFDVGHAVHARILGVGMPVAQIPAHLLSADGGVRSNAAKEWVAEARAAGQIPLKPAVYERVVQASDAVLMHPKARRLLELPGDSEVSMFATDPLTGVRLRGRADRIAGAQILDVKSMVDITTRSLLRVVNDYGYDLQAEAYRFLYELVKGEVAEPVVLICTEKEPPYDVRVVRLGDDWIDGGWRKLRRAIEIYAACVEAGSWPGIDDVDGEIEELAAPSWYAAENARAELEVIG